MTLKHLFLLYQVIFLCSSCEKNTPDNSVDTKTNTIASENSIDSSDSPDARSVLLEKIKKIAADSNISVGEAAVISYENEIVDLPDNKIESSARRHKWCIIDNPLEVSNAIKYAKLGVLRRMLVELAVGGYYLADGERVIYPLNDIYNSLPESADRTTVAHQLVKSEYFNKELQDALATASELSSDSERKIVINGLIGMVHDDITSNKLSSEDLNILAKTLESHGIQGNFKIMVDNEIKKLDSNAK